jgi:hypothetical protein
VKTSSNHAPSSIGAAHVSTAPVPEIELLAWRLGAVARAGTSEAGMEVAAAGRDSGSAGVPNA